MLYCEQCRIKKKWPLPKIYPYHTAEYGRCTECQKYCNCYDTPALFLKEPETVEEKMLDKQFQDDYHTRAESMVITFVQGRQAGHLDHKASEALKGLKVLKNGEVDWYATYQLRLKAQEGYRKTEEMKSRRLL
jgi:hypothetical protein